MRFFKWLYSPDTEPDKRPKPPVVENIPQLRRKEKSIYKPSDLWTNEEDLLFLKYCPFKREKCYHAMSRDLSCRPHEILKLKIKDISFKTLGNSQYTEVVVNGKTGSRPIPLINSIPYLKDYLDHEHPQPGNPNSPLICGTGKGLGRYINWTYVTAEPHRFGGLEFRFKKRELGHLNGERVADLPFPMTTRNELVNSGRVSPHHVLPQPGWVSYWINNGEGDVPAVVELFRMRYEQLKLRPRPKLEEGSKMLNVIINK